MSSRLLLNYGIGPPTVLCAGTSPTWIFGFPNFTACRLRRKATMGGFVLNPTRPRRKAAPVTSPYRSLPTTELSSSKVMPILLQELTTGQYANFARFGLLMHAGTPKTDGSFRNRKANAMHFPTSPKTQLSHGAIPDSFQFSTFIFRTQVLLSG
jgi:hypothetical protein